MTDPENQKKLWREGLATLREQLLDWVFPGAERRKTPRLTVTIPVRFRIPQGREWSIGEAMDLSSTGMRLMAGTYLLQSGNKIELELNLSPKVGKVTIQAEVVWARPSSIPGFDHYGVIFPS